jgi:hypothetical protein
MRANYYIILPDIIGHGKSAKPSDGLRANDRSQGSLRQPWSIVWERAAAS